MKNSKLIFATALLGCLLGAQTASADASLAPTAAAVCSDMVLHLTDESAASQNSVYIYSDAAPATTYAVMGGTYDANMCSGSQFKQMANWGQWSAAPWVSSLPDGSYHLVEVRPIPPATTAGALVDCASDMSYTDCVSNAANSNLTDIAFTVGALPPPPDATTTATSTSAAATDMQEMQMLVLVLLSFTVVITGAVIGYSLTKRA